MKFVFFAFLIFVALLSVAVGFKPHQYPKADVGSASLSSTKVETAPFDERAKHVGLYNGGQLCFANAAIQLLYSMSDFRAMLTNYLAKGITDAHHFQTAIALNDVFQALDAATTSSIYADVRAALPPALQDGKQHDSADVFLFYQAIQMDWKPFKIQRSTLKYIDTWYDRAQHQSLELLLDLPEEFSDRNVSISSLLKSQFPVQASEKNVTSKTVLVNCPRNLIIRLKRFHEGNGIIEKITHPVLADQILELTQSTLTGQDDVPMKYTLRGFIEHRGDKIDQGHYVAYIGNKEYNDDQVRDAEIDPEDPESLLAAKTAYIYWYHLN